MSSVGLGEMEARQQFLDAASAEFLAATGTGVFNENGEELFTDETFRPVLTPAATGSAAAAAAPQFYDISSDADGAAAPAGATRKRISDDVQRIEGRSISPRREPSPNSAPSLTDSSDSETLRTPRTPVRALESRLEISVRMQALKSKNRSPRASRSVSPRAGSGKVAAVEKSEPSADTGVDAILVDSHPEASSSASLPGRRIPLLQGALKKGSMPGRAHSR